MSYFKLSQTDCITKSMTTKEKIQFIKRLLLLIKANIPIETSLLTLAEQRNTGSGKKFFRQILEEVKNGKPLSSALEVSKKGFGKNILSIIKVGEESGTLPDSLEQLTIILEKNKAIRSKIIQALMYPAVIVIGVLSLVAFLVLYIFPKIISVFSSMRISLPVSTRVLIWSSNFLRSNFLWIIVGFLICALVLYLLLKFSNKAKFLISKGSLKIPILGSLIQTYVLVRTSLFLSTLLASNIKVDDALKLVSESIWHPVYKSFFKEAVSEVSGGSKLSDLCARKSRLFPALFTNMIAVGEVSGNFPVVLKDLTSIYESELESFTKALTQMIEPVLMISMSVLVGFVAVSIITPLYSITSNLR